MGCCGRCVALRPCYGGVGSKDAQGPNGALFVCLLGCGLRLEGFREAGRWGECGTREAWGLHERPDSEPNILQQSLHLNDPLQKGTMKRAICYGDPLRKLPVLAADLVSLPLCLPFMFKPQLIGLLVLQEQRGCNSLTLALLRSVFDDQPCSSGASVHP